MKKVVLKLEPTHMILAAVTITPLIYLPVRGLMDYFFLPKVNFLFGLLGFYLLTHLRDHWNRQINVDKDSINVLLLVYAMLLFASLFVADNIVIAFMGKAFRQEGFRVLMLYMVLFLIARKANALNDRLLSFILLSGSVVAMYGVIQYYGLDPIPRDFLLLKFKGAVTTMGNPNYTGTFLVLLTPLSIHLYLVGKNRWSAGAYSIYLLCLLCTRTRGAWLGFLFSVLVYIFFYWQCDCGEQIARKRIGILAGLTLAVILLFNISSPSIALREFLSIFSDAFKVATQSGNVEAAGSYRFFIWKRVIQLIAMKPWLGHGIDHLHMVFNDYFRDDVIQIIGKPMFFERAHNEYLHIAVSSGIPATLTYIGFVGLSVKKGIQRIVRGKELTLLPFLASVSGHLVQALFANSIVSVAYIYWIFLGILVSGQFEMKIENPH